MRYNPSPETANLLNWTLKRIQEAPYAVTARWAFYRCVQELGLQKHDYAKFIRATSIARKRFWNGWMPQTLVDDTRTIYTFGGGHSSYEEWFKEQTEATPQYEPYSTQQEILQIWFEAQAMFSQFRHYAQPLRITVIPFRGDTGVYHKWKIAELLYALYSIHQKPITVLYFGDYEPFADRGSRAKGLTIPISALKDIRRWLGYLIAAKAKQEIAADTEKILKDFRIGLNAEHIEKWKLPENPERPGEFQWEALSEKYAEELIMGSIRKHWSIEAIEALEKRERKDAVGWRKRLKGVG